jgi:predicted nucleic acid-binding protein
MVIFDSSIWVGLIKQTDSQHIKANKLIENFSPPFVVPEYIALETSSVLQNSKLKTEANLFLESLKNSEMYIFLPSSKGLFQKTQEIFIEQEKKLSFVDCSLVALSEEYDIVTFDEGLEKFLNS